MSTFIDTSAVVALLVPEDESHAPAAAAWRELVDADEAVIGTNYILVETCALLHHRAGLSAVRIFLDDVVPALSVEWVDEAIHAAAVAALRTSGRKGPKIVDCSSFAVMRRRGILKAFAYDNHFWAQGFEPVGAPSGSGR